MPTRRAAAGSDPGGIYAELAGVLQGEGVDPACTPEFIESGADRVDEALEGLARISSIVREVRAFAQSIRELPVDEQRTRLIETGYVMPHWPTPYGRAAGAVEQLVIEQEFADEEDSEAAWHDWTVEVRIGKIVELTLQAADEAAAHERVDRMCHELLANPIIESFEIEVAEEA